MKRYWDNLRPFEKRVVAGVATMLFAVFNVWFVLPHFSDWARVKQRMADARWKLGIRQAEIAQLPFYDAQVKKLQGEGLNVPPEDQAIQFSRTVTDEQMRSGVNPRGASRIMTRTNDPFFLEQTQTITVESGEQQLVDFLFNLGSGDSLIRVRDLGLHPDGPRQQLAATIKLAASYQKNTKPASGASRPTVARAPAVRPASSVAPSPGPPNFVTPRPQPGKKTKSP